MPVVMDLGCYNQRWTCLSDINRGIHTRTWKTSKAHTFYVHFNTCTLLSIFPLYFYILYLYYTVCNCFCYLWINLNKTLCIILYCQFLVCYDWFKSITATHVCYYFVSKTEIIKLCVGGWGFICFVLFCFFVVFFVVVFFFCFFWSYKELRTRARFCMLNTDCERNEGTACTVNRAGHTSVTLTHACCLQSEAEWKV